MKGVLRLYVKGLAQGLAHNWFSININYYYHYCNMSNVYPLTIGTMPPFFLMLT